MKILFSIELFLLLFTSCNTKKPEAKIQHSVKIENPNDDYTIKGIMVGIDSGWVFIAHADSTGREIGKIDSAKIKNGNFEFKGIAIEPEICTLGIRYTKYKSKHPFFSFTFFLDKGILNMKCFKDSLYQSLAWGTKAQDEFKAFKENYYPVLYQSNNAYAIKLKAQRQHNQKILDSLAKVFKKYSDQMNEIVIRQAKANRCSLVSAYIVKEHLLANPDPEILDPLYDGFDPKIKDTYFGRKIFSALIASKKTSIGSIPPYINLPNKSGNKISLLSYKGKYVLIDFWASWCAPCRAENPNLIKAYDQFHSKGFDILSISLDDNRTAWLKAVDQDKLPWLQVSDLKGHSSEVKELYGINAIPMNFLLDKEGKVIAKNLRGEELQKTLASFLK